LDIAQLAVERAKKAGAGGAAVAAEAYVNDTESIQVNVSARAVEQMSAVKEAGIGIRVLRDGKMAFGSTNDLSKAPWRSSTTGQRSSTTRPTSSTSSPAWARRPGVGSRRPRDLGC
jgi:predicted Zn-dependent protease